MVIGPLSPKVPNSDLNYHLMQHPFIGSFHGDSPSIGSLDPGDFQEYQETVAELYQKHPIYERRALNPESPLSHPMMIPHKKKFQLSQTPGAVVSQVAKNNYERGSK